MEFTVKQIETDNCYLCSRNHQKELYVINSIFNWELCIEEWKQQITEQDNSNTTRIENNTLCVHCNVYGT